MRLEVKEGLPEEHEQGVCGSTGFGGGLWKD